MDIYEIKTCGQLLAGSPDVKDGDVSDFGDLLAPEADFEMPLNMLNHP